MREIETNDEKIAPLVVITNRRMISTPEQIPSLWILQRPLVFLKSAERVLSSPSLLSKKKRAAEDKCDFK